MDTVELAIQSALEAIPERSETEQWQGERPWSVAVKAAIVGVGREFGWLTAANGCETDEGKEWLYDVVWYQSDRADHMTDVSLVAESEWGGENAIKEDFEKLLVSRSKYRVMIFQVDSDEAALRLFQKMRLWIAKFHRTNVGDRYLLAGWVNNHWKFDLHVE
ncbi:hypothetical protein [Desulfobulbus alkaliphilus]|uniref:hypothetical protein n=1 Tax=Desulfobulbus alkaliphilus TaxID=869814 RepID=UPI001963EF9B|nr:hypothetical protein [Desulfobulbus alkaliphilus]MBM9536188.1 hypothetical protein [Desulfobulbus alkaliphilus]